MDYDFHSIEAKWRQHYDEKKPFAFDPHGNGPKYYCLEMFPYPSGKLHIGHVRNYSLGDVLARYKRLQGYNVLHPIGWDAFGLPAENAAIESNIHPAKWTFSNIKALREQLKTLGFSYDHDNEVCTAEADYYKWGQWLFLQFYKKGLAYKKKAWVNWDPIDQTVLANEQVIDGRGWRSGVEVEKKLISQWFFKITDYADELLSSLDTLEKWPYKVKAMQRNWIGASTGYIIHFKYKNRPFPCFTTRADTIFGVTFMGIAFNHLDIETYIEATGADRQKILDFITACTKLNQNSDYVKEGMFTGAFIDHPILDKKIPLYVTNFVLAEYGTGTVMGCPAHDARDFEFAKKMDLPCIRVIRPSAMSQEDALLPMDAPFVEEGVMLNSQELDGLPSVDARKLSGQRMLDQKIATEKTEYRLRDWLFSRQRYWGNPIPILKKSSDESLEPVAEKDLPVTLPLDVTFDSARSPLLTHKDFTTATTQDGESAERERDTMDTFTCSSWYFLRFIDPHNKTAAFDKDLVAKWMSVDLYIGGIEHACLHLLYARFFYKALRDIGLVQGDEPLPALLSQGMVVAPSYYSPAAKKYFAPEELEPAADAPDAAPTEKVCPQTGKPLIVKTEKMSKSKKNGVSPEAMIERYGADSLRLFVLFAAPPEKNLEWNEGGIEGCQRFLIRLTRIVKTLKAQTKQLAQTEPLNPASPAQAPIASPSKWTRAFYEILHPVIRKVTEDIERLHFNTAIAALMKASNALASLSPQTPDDIRTFREGVLSFLTILSPFAPFLSEELAETLGADQPRYAAAWPEVDEAYCVQQARPIMIQVNGKIRAEFTPQKDSSQADIIALAQAQPTIKSRLDGQKIVKTIYVPEKIVNFVVQTPK